MVRTKYLVIAIFVCIAVIFSVGMLPRTDERASTGFPLNNNAIFTTPKEHYTVAGTSLDTRMKEREAFKARVQATLRAEPVPITEEEVTEDDLMVTTPTEIIPEEAMYTPPPMTPGTDVSLTPETIPTTTVHISPSTTPPVTQVATTSEAVATENSEI